MIGVLAIQGAVSEHLDALRKCGIEAIPVRKPDEIRDLEGLIIPGGESTTIGKLMERYGLDKEIKLQAKKGLTIFGTCAGLILLAKEIVGSDQPTLGLMDITVQRNAFGRQRESFEAGIEVPVLGNHPVRGVFIRAPYIVKAGQGVEIMALFEGKIVMAREGNTLVTAFHPELTEDLRVHQYFVEMTKVV